LGEFQLLGLSIIFSSFPAFNRSEPFRTSKPRSPGTRWQTRVALVVGAKHWTLRGFRRLGGVAQAAYVYGKANGAMGISGVGRGMYEQQYIST